MNEVPPPPIHWRHQCLLAGLYLVLAVTLRSPTFLRSVLDWDESLYFLMAEQWRAGHLPYTTIWDNKPVGIYAIFASFQAVFGDRIVAMRLAACVFTALGTFAVHRIAVGVSLRRWAGFCAGLLYLLCILSNDGLSANTEIFMAAFTACSVWAALSPPRRGVALQAGLAGLCAGAAFMIKYVSAGEALATLALLMMQNRRRDILTTTAAFIAGAALPLAAAMALYAAAGQLPVWWNDSIAANFRRLSPPVPPGALHAAVVQQFWRWGPLYAAALVLLADGARQCANALRRRQLSPNETHSIFLALWFLAALAGAAVAKLFYDHYFLQLLPVLCVCTAWLLGKIFPRSGQTRQILAGLAILACLTFPAQAGWAALQDCLSPVLSVQNGDYRLQLDDPSRIGQDIRTASPTPWTGPLLYVFDSQPIIYALAKQVPPTRYVLPSVLTRSVLDRVAVVDPVAEIQRILALGPRFIVVAHTRPDGFNPAVYNLLGATLAAQYTLWRQYPSADVYQNIKAKH